MIKAKIKSLRCLVRRCAVLWLFGYSTSVGAAPVTYVIDSTSDWFSNTQVNLTGSFVYDDTPGMEALTDLQLNLAVNINETLAFDPTILSTFSDSDLFTALTGGGGAPVEFLNDDFAAGFAVVDSTSVYGSFALSTVPPPPPFIPPAGFVDRGAWDVTNVGGNAYEIDTISDWLDPSIGSTTGSFEYDSVSEILSNAQVNIVLGVSDVISLDPGFEASVSPQDLFNLLTGAPSSIGNTEFVGDTFVGGLIADGTYVFSFLDSAVLGSSGFPVSFTRFDQGTWSVSSTATSVPEPSTLGLIGVGLLGFFIRRKRVA